MHTHGTRINEQKKRRCIGDRRTGLRDSDTYRRQSKQCIARGCLNYIASFLQRGLYFWTVARTIGSTALPDGRTYGRTGVSRFVHHRCMHANGRQPRSVCTNTGANIIRRPCVGTSGCATVLYSARVRYTASGSGMRELGNENKVDDVAEVAGNTAIRA